jgi:hypothetical protein
MALDLIWLWMLKLVAEAMYCVLINIGVNNIKMFLALVKTSENSSTVLYKGTQFLKLISLYLCKTLQLMYFRILCAAFHEMLWVVIGFIKILICNRLKFVYEQLKNSATICHARMYFEIPK